MARKKKPTQRMTPPPQQAPPGPAQAAAMPAPQPLANEKATLADLIKAIESQRKSSVIVYWLTDNARISEAVIVPLYDHLQAIGKQESIDVVLFTRGGDTEAPWRFTSLIREYCKKFSVLIPHRAHSAGTLLALGANEIVMTPLGLLGPIDPYRTHPLLPTSAGATEPEPISVQDMRHAMQFIREAGGQGVAYTPEAMAQIFSALFEKIHPLAIGAIEQSYALAKLVGKQCLSTHMDPAKDEALIVSLVDKLCDEYKSHAYQISRAEARAIGLKAVDAPPALEKAMMDLYKFYLGRPIAPVPLPKSGQVTMHIGWLDSTAVSMRAEAIYEITAGQAKYLGDQWRPY